MKKQLLALTLILLLVLVVGCLPTEVSKEVGKAPAETAVTAEVGEVDTLSDDLSTSDLDSLDKDLAEVTW